MAQKYPHEGTPYRYARAPRVHCCYDHTGRAKAVYDSRANAARKAWDGQEPYACLQHEGKWHLRTKRL